MLNPAISGKASTGDAGKLSGIEMPARVDGIDVAQLLHDIGEASARQSSVELFRLCLGAQHVLHSVFQHQDGAPR
jgi:hypothetical protein